MVKLVNLKKLKMKIKMGVIKLRTEDYELKGKNTPVNYLTDEEWKKLLDTTSVASWKKRLLRGIRINEDVFIKDSAKIGKTVLIEHEVGHVLGFKHTWLPVTMNRTWLFRWFRWMSNV